MGPKTRLKVRNVCFACLKQFEVSKPCRQRLKLTPPAGSTSEDNQNQIDVFKNFLSFIDQYLGVPSAQYLFLSLLSETDGKKKRNKKQKEEQFATFCDVCVKVICSICDIYHELCVVQRRLSSTLGELGELIDKTKRTTVSDKRRQQSALPLKSLAEQLCVKEISHVDELRLVIASKCKSKRNEISSSTMLIKSVDPPSQTKGESFGKSDLKEANVKMEVDYPSFENEQLNNNWPDDDYDDCNMLSEPVAGVSLENFPVPPSNIKSEVTAELINKSYNSQEQGPSQAACSKTSDALELEDADNVQGPEVESGSEYCPSDNGSNYKVSEDEEDVSMKQARKKEKCSKAETIPGTTRGRKRKFEPAEDTESPCCHLCGAMFNTTSLLATHLNQKHETGKGEIKCSFCWMSFSFEQTYNAHLKLKHKRINEPLEELFKCDSTECKFKAGDLSKLNNHLKTHADSDNIHYCLVCNHGFLSKSLMKYHELVHTRPVRGLITCPQCKKVLHGLQNFMDHFNFKHGEKLELYKCPKCDRKLSSEGILNWHLKWHKKKEEGDPEEELKIIKCRTCGKKCKDKESLDAHERLQHPPKECQECGAKLKNKELLRRHMTSEHTTRKYTCSICGEVFHFIKRYDKHMQNVHNVTGFECSICNKTFTFRHSLNTHMKILHAETKETHLCQQCGDTFSSASYLREHIERRHSEQKTVKDGRHACPYCGDRFVRIFQVQKHMKKCEKNPHPGVESTAVASQLPTQSVICDQCGKAFTSAGMLRVHARRVHC